MRVADATHVPSTTSGPFPRRPGNRVRTFIGGHEIARAIKDAVAGARHSVWLTLAFYTSDFQFPDGAGMLFDMLDEAVSRGLDVRMLVWRPNAETRPSHRIFGGTPEQRAWLAERGSRIRIRWDRASGPFCQHQKSWVIDAGQDSEVAFVGGLNPTDKAMVMHDLYAEIVGPSAADVRGNFIERWNEASERFASDGNWTCDATDELPATGTLPSRSGSAEVQIQRMLDRNRYPANRVDQSIVEQYQLAIDAARRTIYLENQAIPMPVVARPLLRAVERGVDVVLLVPAVPEPYIFDARLDPAEKNRFEGIEALGRYPNFTLAGLSEVVQGQRRAAYVHAKMMVVDDCWLTLGSCNLHPYSLAGHSEMNASIWDPGVARDLRQRLLLRHLGEEVRGLDDRAGLRRFRALALDNAGRLARRERDWRGAVFTLVPEDYATPRGHKLDLT